MLEPGPPPQTHTHTDTQPQTMPAAGVAATTRQNRQNPYNMQHAGAWSMQQRANGKGE